MVSHLASAAGLAGPWVMSSDSPGVPEADPAACAAEALRLLQAHAYFADRVDWVSVTAEVSRAVDQGASLASALRPVWRELGDRHSFLRPAESTRTSGPAGDVPAGRRLPANLGYLRLPGIATGTRTAAALEYVAAAWARLRARPRPSGWVLDLRGNGGGNIVPMLAAAGPLLGPGEWLAYQRRDGGALRYSYSAGEVRADGRQMLLAPDPPSDDPEVPVAMLVDRHTASGSLLLITTSLAVDRRGRCHAAAVVPGREGGVAEARAWLNTQRPR
jgi:carboxyl-terminal processing protease